MANSNIVQGVTYSLFAHLSKSAGSDYYDTIAMWLNPEDEEKRTLTGADLVATGTSGLTSFDTIGFRVANINGQNVTINANGLDVAEVREPSSIALLDLASRPGVHPSQARLIGVEWHLPAILPGIETRCPQRVLFWGWSTSGRFCHERFLVY